MLCVVVAATLEGRDPHQWKSSLNLLHLSQWNTDIPSVTHPRPNTSGNKGSPKSSCLICSTEVTLEVSNRECHMHGLLPGKDYLGDSLCGPQSHVSIQNHNNLDIPGEYEPVPKKHQSTRRTNSMHLEHYQCEVNLQVQIASKSCPTVE